MPRQSEVNEIIEEGLWDWEDLTYAVVYQVLSHRMEVKVYAVCGHCKGEPLYERKGGMGGMDTVTDIKEAQVYLDGQVKWDGCSNWIYPEMQENCMDHFCSRESLIDVGKLMARIWDEARDRIPRWYG